MRKPLIGILGHKHTGRIDGYGQNEAYIEYFREFGNVIILDAQCDEVMPIDLLVLPGGRDVNPLRYGQKPNRYTQSPDLEYEYFYKNMFWEYMEIVKKGKMAIYGICAGFQNLIVEFEGTLDQHIAQDQSKERHELTDDLEFNNHFFDGNKFLFKEFQFYRSRNEFKKTNSIHHQGAYEENIPDCFHIVATNKTYKNIEFIQHKKYLIAAEQSHPEERLNPLLSNLLITNLLNLISYD